VLNQTYPNYEVLIVNNNSTDNTQEIIDKFASQYSHLVPLFQKKQGVGVSRNLGIEKATGPILMFTDSDCILPPTWVSDLSQPIREEGEQATQGFQHDLVNNYWTKNIQDLDWQFFLRNTKGKYTTAFDGKNFAVVSKIAKALLFDPNIKMADDFDFSIRLKKLTPIRFLPDVRAGHFHKSSLKSMMRTNFIRAYWLSYMHQKYAPQFIKDEVQFESFSIKNWLTFPAWATLQFLQQKPNKALFLLLSELSWRAGLIKGKSEFLFKPVKRF
tara:strand:+ start:524 stop:1336 length:813 start_codon:yes stop_codon:yes gene_type:complete